MACRHTKIPVATEHGIEYAHAIVCGRRTPVQRCVVCGTQYDMKLCDFPLRRDKTGKTCDRPVCGTHAHHVEPDTDLCPTHARVMQAKQMELMP